MQLSADEVARYQRQMMIPGWGQEAQRALKESSVFEPQPPDSPRRISNRGEQGGLGTDDAHAARTQRDTACLSCGDSDTDRG